MINIKRILCPTDLSPLSGKAERYALALARAHEAELIFFHCTPDVDGEEKLKASVSEHTGASDARVMVTTADDIGEAIMVQAQAENVDLIVMRSRRRPK